MQRTRIGAILAPSALLVIVLSACRGSVQTHAATAQPLAAQTAYARDVQPVIAANCVSCHSGSAQSPAPFPLLTYRDVEKRAAQIARVTRAGYMPPWKPDARGEFIGERRLSATAIATLSCWSEAGAPLGLPDARPATSPSGPPQQPSLGTPDLVLAPAAASLLPAAGLDSYRCYLLPTRFPADKYLAAVAFLPGNASASDHALIYADPARRFRFLNQDRLDASGSFTVEGGETGLQPSMLIAAAGRVTTPQTYPPGCGSLLPKGADLVLEVHYHPTGKPESDRPRLGLYFCKQPVTRRVRVAPLVAQGLRLPSKRPVIGVGGQFPVLSDIKILSIAPYLRRRGASISVYALRRDKTAPEMLNIPDWDFDWIGNYTLKEPRLIPAGSLLAMGAFFAGSSAAEEASPADQPLTWGETPQDENAVAYVFYITVPSKGDPSGDRPGIPELGAPTDAGVHKILLQMFDTNRDGTVDSQEAQKMRGYFQGSMPSVAGMEM